MPCRTFSRIPGLSSLDASCPPFLEYKKCFNIARCSPGVRITASDFRMRLYAWSYPILATPWNVARQAPLFMGFSRPDYWSGLVFPPPGDLPDPGRDQTRSSCDSCVAGGFFTTEPSGYPVSKEGRNISSTAGSSRRKGDGRWSEQSGRINSVILSSGGGQGSTL